LSQIYEKMKSRNSELEAGQFTSIVQIWHEDASFFFLPCAYCEEDGDYLYIYTEHCGFFYFAKEDLSDWRIKMADGSYKTKPN
jgi:hypothetical protein